MKLNKRLQLNVAVSLLSAFAACLVLFLSLYHLNKAINLAKIAGEIITSALESVTLRNDYIRNSSERAKEQWVAKNDQVGGLLKAAAEDFRGTEDRENIAGLIEDHESIEKIFSAIVTNREKIGWNSGSADLSREVEDRLLNQLNMRVYEVVIHGRKLLESSRDARASALRLAGGGVVTSLLIIIAATMINSWSMGRAITDRVGRLRDGAAMIGGGDLDQRIDVKGDDEFAELSEAFNSMAVKLNGSYQILENQIAERKRTEETLRETRDYLESLLNYANAPIIVWDSSFRVTSFNHAFERLTGLKADEVIGKQLDILFPDSSREDSMGLIKSALSGERWEIVEIPIKHTDGLVHTVLWNSANIHDRDNRKVIATIAQGQDITERKRAEEKVQESRARLEAALASMTDAVFISDAEGRFIEFNDAFATFHRFKSKEECVKTFAEHPHILDVFMSDGTPAPLEMWAVPRALRGETVTNAEYTLRRKDTDNFWIGSYSFAPIREVDGKIVGSVVVARDITDRKLAEQTLQEAHGELVRLVEERTRELREKEVLLKEIHHRVKNNLQVISSLIGLQADGSKDETVRTVLRDVTDRVRSMALVHEKLYQSADLARIDFAEYAKGLLGYLWRAYGTGVASFQLTLDLEPVLLPVDIAVPCGLILNELAGNALKHAFRGRSGGEVTVSLERGEDGRISICVGDNGVGLPQGLDWRQASSLGLRLVQLLSRQLGAEVNVSGGDGTRFEVVFSPII